MTVYAKRINNAQRKYMEEFENISGFEFMHQEDIDSGIMTFTQAWNANILFIESVAADVVNISTSGACVISCD